MTTISIARALVELKTLDARINKIISNKVWISYKSKNKNAGVSEEEYMRLITSSYQSVNDLITRRNYLKNAIIKSNNTAEVEVAGVKMTVSNAIEYKHTIVYKHLLLEALKAQRRTVTVDYENHRQRVQNKIDENIKLVCGKEAKVDENIIKSVTDGINNSDPFKVLDPLNLDVLIDKLETEIEDFNANIDYVLSESNALTTIVDTCPVSAQDIGVTIDKTIPKTKSLAGTGGRL